MNEADILGYVEEPVKRAPVLYDVGSEGVLIFASSGARACAAKCKYQDSDPQKWV